MCFMQVHYNLFLLALHAFIYGAVCWINCSHNFPSLKILHNHTEVSFFQHFSLEFYILLMLSALDKICHFFHFVFKYL